MRVRTCLRCGHTGEALDAGGLCNQLVMRDGHGDTCGCSCTWDKVTVVKDERDGHLGEVIDRRVQVYGDPVAGFAEIATMWSVLFDVEIPAWKVPIAQALMKVVRMKTSPDYSDHSDDIDGYLDIFRKIIGPDMIEARTVNEYIEKKWPARVVDFGVPQDNARQSEFYAENDRTKDAGPDEEYNPRSINEMRQDGTLPIDHAACTMLGDHEPSTRHRRDECPVNQEPVPYTLPEDERAQHLQRAATVRDMCTCWGNEGPVACPVHVTKDPS